MTMQDRGGVAGAQVQLFLQWTRIDLSGITNSSGAIFLSNVPQPQELLITVKAGTTDSIVLA